MKQYFAFQWHIADACDQRCKHCYIFSENTCKKIESMSWEQMQETFDNCLDFCKVYGRLPYFYITGGDPILHPHFWQLLADCDRKFKEYEAAGCQTYFNKKDHLWTLYEYETGTFQIPETVEEGMIYGGCNCGNCHLTIVPNGDVYACRRVQNSKVGNVFSDRLADVWVCQMEGYRDYSRFRKCAKCELLAFCRGCPAVASGKDGDFYAADPQCWKEVG